MPDGSEIGVLRLNWCSMKMTIFYCMFQEFEPVSIPSEKECRKKRIRVRIERIKRRYICLKKYKGGSRVENFYESKAFYMSYNVREADSSSFPRSAVFNTKA